MKGAKQVFGQGGPSSDRVVELVVSHGAGRRRGSGYRVSAEAVLTTAHVVDGALSVQVRGESGAGARWATDGLSWWADVATDLAVVSVGAGAGPDDAPEPAPVEFARVGDHVTSFEIEAVGFPRWKVRNEDGSIPMPGDGARRFYDSHHALGTVAALSNRREGTWEVTFGSAPETGATAGSVWSGMSGAALWASGHVVGVVSEHHSSDGPARLAASRIDRALDRLAPSALGELRALLPMLPERSASLPDVAVVDSGVQRAHRAQLRQFAPLELVGRSRELDELTRFCESDEPYMYWTAGPWAGKTALLAWFSLHPPPAVDVVSFFVNSQYSGQSDSDAFTESIFAQLSALVGEPELPLASSPSLRGGALLDLLTIAAERSEQAQRRLLLIVDGLDEDTSTAGGIAKPAIVTLLPRYPPPGLRVLLAGRPFPVLQGDLPQDHPLSGLSPTVLTPSAVAVGIEKAARDELGQLMRGSALQRDVVGLVTASGGGLTQSDLRELTGSSAFDVEDLVRGTFARTIVSLLGPVPPGEAAEQVLVFGHETLRSTAEQTFGPTTLGTYRDRIHAWVETYRTRGFPEVTPRYLLRGYPRLLTAIGDLPRLVGLATDSRRHDWMRDATGSDAAALADITSASHLVAGTGDLATLVLISSRRERLAQRNTTIPPLLPAVWTTIGDSVRASGLASFVVDPERRAECLTAMVCAALRRGDSAEPLIAAAVRQVSGIEDRRGAITALITLVEALASGGRQEQARQLLLELPDLWFRSLTKIESWAEPIVLWEIDPLWRRYPKVMVAMVGAVAAAGEVGRAQTMADNLNRPLDRLAAYTVLINYLSTTREHHHARRVIDSAHRTISALADLAKKGDGSSGRSPVQRRTLEVVGDVVIAVAALNDPSLSRTIANRVAALSDHEVRSESRLGPSLLASSQAWAGEFDRAESSARRETGESRAHALAGIVPPAVRAGDENRADRLIAEITRLVPGVAAVPVLTRLATDLADGGDRQRALPLLALAEARARTLGEPIARAQAWMTLLLPSARAGDYERAERLAVDGTAATSGPGWAEVLADLAAFTAKDGDRDRAIRLAVLAEEQASALDEPWLRSCMLLDLANGLVQADDIEQIHRVITAVEDEVAEITDSARRCQVTTWLIEVAVAVNDAEHARQLAVQAYQLAAELAPEDQRQQAFAALVEPVARAGDLVRAEQLAFELSEPQPALDALIRLMTEAHRTGKHDLANRLAEHVQDRLSKTTNRGLTQSIGGPSFWSVDPDYGLAYIRYHQSLVERVAAAGDYETAEVYARRAGEGGLGARYLAQLAWTAADNGEFTVARRLVDELTSLSWPDPEALIELAHAVAALGNPRQAHALARSAEQHIRSSAAPPLPDHLLSQLSSAMLAAGDVKRAEGLAREMRDETQRLWALSLVAESAAKEETHRSTTRRLLMEIAGTSNWPFAIRALADWDPQALQRLADAMIPPPATETPHSTEP